jgi:transcriptional regulator with AAA-type ATPase domain
LDGCSAAKRTSMGPETEARHCVSPFDAITCQGDAEHWRSRTYQRQIVPIHLPCLASRKQCAEALYRHFFAHRLSKKASRQQAQVEVENK